MQPLTRQDLYSLEEYAKLRNDFRARVMRHKRTRQVPVGANATLYFEDRLTMQYQVQEMLRVERIFEAEGIQEELDAYNPLLSDGSNWKATFMLEFSDEDERRAALARLRGIEDKVWIQVVGHDKVWGIADEDLERDDETKTSAVHFLRFELSSEMVAEVKRGGQISAGTEHEHYRYQMDLGSAVRNSLAADLS